MWTIPLIIAFLGGFLGVADKLLSSDRRARIIGVASILVLLAGLAWQGFFTHLKIRSIEQLKVFTHSGLSKVVDEASGGTFDPTSRVAYVVDDDDPNLFMFKFQESENEYKFIAAIPLYDESGAKLDDSNLEDLEAITYFDEKLYAITSHSNRKTGRQESNRQRLLEIRVDNKSQGRVTRSTNLRKAILARFDRPVAGLNGPLHNTPRDKEDRLEVMNIEGLAIGPDGQVYIGFRSPLVYDGYALVLTAKLEELFKADPKLDAVLLELLYEGQHYAITDMSFDINQKDVLIISNSRKRLEFFSPVLWRWQPKPNLPGIQFAMRLQEGLMMTPEHFRAKPEAIVISGDGNIGLFADAEGYGGQQVYDRNELGLK